MRQLFFVTLLQTPWAFFLTQLSVSLYLLPVLRGRFDSNVHVTVLRLPALHAHEAKTNCTDVTFLES